LFHLSFKCIFAPFKKEIVRGKKVLPLINNLEIVDIAAEGKAIGKADGIVVFVPYVAPGDIVDVQVTRKRRSYMEASVVNFHKFSGLRIKPECEHFSLCGGCKWQHIHYESQLHYKHKQVEDQLVRIGKLGVPAINPIIPSDNTFFYRNKLEFTFSISRWLTIEEIKSGIDIPDRNALGFHIPEMFDKVFDVKKCWLQPDPSNTIRDTVRAFAIENGMPFFDLRNHNGFLRNLTIRTSSTGDLMVIVSFYTDNIEWREKLLDHLAEKFTAITSLMYVINSKPNDTITDQEIICYKGNDHIFEEMEGLRFKIGPKSFYQTNSQQAYKLYKVAREFADLKGHETVYDLYTGTGTIANFIAHHAGKVIGIEFVPEAIEDARNNSKLNRINNTEFFAGDIKNVMNNNFIEAHGRPDVVILDPPRAGVHRDVIDTLLYILPERIVYVSCNPATQARDLAFLKDAYHINAVQPVDMFPQTQHVENVVRLIRNN
jgi:23S rRNA (uracil1939-C5)-methyltransferase